MKKFVIAGLISFLFVAQALAVSPDYRLCDSDGDCLNINADGTVPTSGGGSAPTGSGFIHVTGGTQDDAARVIDLASTDVTGTLTVGKGGTGVATGFNHGYVPIGNGTGFTMASITSGANVTVTNTAGAISIAATGGSASAAGSNTWLQWNDNGSFGANIGLTYAPGTNVLTLTASADAVHVVNKANATQTNNFQNWTDSDGTVFLAIPGISSTFSGANNTLIGATAGDSITTGARNVFIGDNAGTAISTNSDLTMVGYNAGALTTGVQNSFFGSQAGDAVTIGTENVCVGYLACSAMDDSYNTIVGNSAMNVATTAQGNTIIGRIAGTAITTGDGNIYIGANAGLGQTSGSNQFIAGSNEYPVNDVWFGKGEAQAAPTDYTIHGGDGVGSDKTGANLIIAGGRGTGNALNGQIIFKASPGAASGTTLQTLANKFVVSADRITVSIQSSAAPGAPARGDMYVDTDTNELCFYTGSAWIGLVAAGSCA